MVVFLLKSLCQARATERFNLPSTSEMVLPSDRFSPLVIKGIKIYPKNPLRFDFIINKGDENFDIAKQGYTSLKRESERLINYFLASLAVPEEDIWVNLSPYESDRIIPEALGQTEMGRDLLAQDYLLKQLTASLMYPETELGEKFWDKAHKKINEQYDQSEPLQTFNKVWILPQKAVVYENAETNVAFILESQLKVMLEEDYMASENIDFHNNKTIKSNGHQGNSNSSEIMKEVILPIIEKEVNQGKNFAKLRQVYHSLILAAWFKQKLSQSLSGGHKALLEEAYVDKNKVEGINLEDTKVGQKIYHQYLRAFKIGVYDYIREEYDPLTQNIIPRKYFSGGIVGNFNIENSSILTTPRDSGDFAMVTEEETFIAKSSLKLQEIKKSKYPSIAIDEENRLSYQPSELQLNALLPNGERKNIVKILENILKKHFGENFLVSLTGSASYILTEEGKPHTRFVDDIDLRIYLLENISYETRDLIHKEFFDALYNAGIDKDNSIYLNKGKKHEVHLAFSPIELLFKQNISGTFEAMLHYKPTDVFWGNLTLLDDWLYCRRQ